ncbi:hypothetical protein MHU86_12944 [Fragilaria crotonensis]|nr:hypothetical protein MHU86_12944 [Fragilaria crotonensis]
MTEGTAPLPFFASDNPPDVTASVFNFTIVAYVQTPALIERENDSKAAIENRKVDDDSYRRSVSPTSWHRFTTLGFQATHGKDFDMIWRDRNSNPFVFIDSYGITTRLTLIVNAMLTLSYTHGQPTSRIHFYSNIHQNRWKWTQNGLVGHAFLLILLNT